MKMKESHKTIYLNYPLCIDIQPNNYFTFVKDNYETKFPDFLRIFQKRTLTHPDGPKTNSPAHTIQIDLPARNPVRKGIVAVQKRISLA